MTEAPEWLAEAYMAHGEEFAAWIHDKPLVKAGVKALMDLVLATYELPETVAAQDAQD